MNKGLKLVLFGAGAILTAGVATGIYLAHKDPEYNINKIVKSRKKKEKVDIPHPNLENETFEDFNIYKAVIKTTTGQVMEVEYAW